VTRKVMLAFGLSVVVLLVMLSILTQEPQTVAQEPEYDEFIYLPLVARAYWDPVEGDEFYIGQRSSSLCAEHDSYVVAVATVIESDTMQAETEVTTQYRIRATHPISEVHPNGAPWTQWCDADWENCPTEQQSWKSSF